MTKDEVFKRYLAILGVEAASASLDHLTRLVRAQTMRVPFENVSKLLLKRIEGASYIPPLEQHLNGIERHGFGGTGYANNAYFCELLRYLGYDVDLCGAEMTRPDVHTSKMRDQRPRKCGRAGRNRQRADRDPRGTAARGRRWTLPGWRDIHLSVDRRETPDY